jgi:MoxR-like ATPase
VFVHHAVVDYVVRLVIATREPAEFGMHDVAGWVSFGASPRASLGLIAAGRALALLRGRDYVLPQDVLDLAQDVLPHRLVLSYDAIADGITAAQAIGRVLQTVQLPQVAPRQRAAGGYLPAASSAPPQASTAPPPGARGYPNGAQVGQPAAGNWTAQT